MKVLRYLDADGAVRFAARLAHGDFEIEGDIFEHFEVTQRPARVSRLLAPVVPAQILCVGMNYRRHAEETKGRIPEFPVLFMKNIASVQNPGDPILLPRHLRADEVDYECELAVVIGRPAKNVPRARALEYVLGYTCANDVSARDWQLRRSGSQWCRAKSFDTFCPLGPVLVTPDEIPDPGILGIRTRLNGEAVQDWTTNDMIFDVPTIIEFLSGSTTLPPGTVILTGTPHGVGMAREPKLWLKPGDHVAIEIDGIGTLENPVLEEPRSLGSADPDAPAPGHEISP
jgi:2-keto-4-pentenoate hydratase/2-oxohepta-3-ene-1,7-dioic acid hydratase in catechol pathway